MRMTFQRKADMLTVIDQNTIQLTERKLMFTRQLPDTDMRTYY